MCESAGALGSVDFCSPSYAITQGSRPQGPYPLEAEDVLVSYRPFQSGWSHIARKLGAKRNAGVTTITLYLLQGPPGSPSYFRNLQIEIVQEHPDYAATPLVTEVPLAIDCSLPGWFMRHAVRECGGSHYGRDNVLTVRDDGIW